MEQKKSDAETILAITFGYFHCIGHGWELFRINTLWDFLAIVANFFLCLYFCQNMSGEEFFWGFFVLYAAFFSCHMFVRGLPRFCRRLKQRNLLEKTTIKDYRGKAPQIKSIKKNIDNSISLNLDLMGTDPELFERKKKIIETTYDLHYHGLEDSKSPRYKSLLLTPVTLPTVFNFEDVLEKISRPYHVITGMGVNKPLITDISSWPHGLIAGSTGSGKSVQMKSIIAQFIHSTMDSNAQIVLCDLKGGVEFSQFKDFKNVKILSEIKEISHALKIIEKEMLKRFDIMREKNIQKIDPEKHKKNFILIAIDEASLLYKRVYRDHSDYKDIEQARESTQKILKLGRAARISVLFGLQRPSKESIDTEVQENIDARICFKINTIEGSIRMLGHKGGVDLPNIPGRGIWKFGNEEMVFQAPLITNQNIEELKNKTNEKAINAKQQLDLTIKNDVKNPTAREIKEESGEQ